MHGPDARCSGAMRSTNKGDGSGTIDKAKDTTTVRTTSTDGAHTHTITLSTGVSGSAGSGTALDFAVAYVDIIIAAKD